ncbi:hypothetical protein [Thermostichus vulcanus]|uniref:O-antigen ligase domain-containing protein n=1 Tax=Thermostichus vulcanus str. 'Rupite' TaxID=2813851 RepID=A0ABT0CE02_THEVL|nr:hypothetical protein [Thermostichus vulcanus]MCJ2544008.1 hypothetical protein [Thermostichus vulcanus str. 'Rupite']
MNQLVLPAATVAYVQRREKQRQFVVWAVFFIYFLSLIEGPLRKWFLPELAGPLTLLRDPFVIALYLYCLSNGWILRKGLGGLWLGFAVLTSWFGLIQFVINGLPITGWILGVRTYWLYMPLAFVIAKSFRREDVMRFLRLNLWIALPYALLVASQYNAGAAAFINRGVGGDESAAVGVSDGILRPFGLFTYTGPNVQFTAAMIAMYTAVFLAEPKERPPLPWFVAMALAVATMSVLTGSRSIYFSAAIILGLTILGMLATRLTTQSLLKIAGIITFVVLAGVLLVEFFPDMLAAMDARFARAARSEGSLWVRAFSGLTRPFDALGTAPLFGYGIGVGAPGVARFIGLAPLIYGESDLQRNINELGLLFGVIMIAFRFGTVSWVVLTTVRIAQRGLSVGLPLAGLTFEPLLVGQITHSPLNSFLVWISVGLIVSLMNSMLRNHNDALY